MNKRIRLMTMALTTVLTVGTCTPAFADSSKILSMAHDLTKDQKNAVYTQLNIKESDCQVIDITNKDERTALAGIVPEAEIGTKTISCAYVEPADAGKGITITLTNLTWVSEPMLKNALITAGVKDATVKAVAPYPVSGTGALTGVMKAYEKATGETLTPEKKDAANQELVATGKIAETKGLDQAKASALVNDVKKEVIAEKPKSDAQIGTIINNVTNNYGTSLSDSDKQMLISVMSKINSLDYNSKEMNNTLNDISKSMKDQLAQTGTIIKELGTLDKIKEKLDEIGQYIKEGWAKLTNHTISVDGITYTKDGKIDTKGNVFIPNETKSTEELKELDQNKEETKSTVDVSEAQNKIEDATSPDTKITSTNADQTIQANGTKTKK